MTFGSLFAGIGGLDLGLERSGMTCAWQVEIDEYCRRVLTKHWPEVPKYGDIRECGAANLARVDLVCGGFPCQDISYAGRGAGLAGERSGLWFEYARVVRELRPRFVIVENVAALLRRGLDRVLGDLAALGYDAEWHCIPAAAVGAPHIRDRVFILAYPARGGAAWLGTGHENARLGPACGREERLVADATIDGWEPRWPSDTQEWPRWRHVGRGGQRASVGHAERAGLALWEVLTRGLQRELAAAVRAGGAGSAQWETEPDVGRVADGVPRRVDRLRGLGNAVVPQVAEVIGRAIMAAEGASNAA